MGVGWCGSGSVPVSRRLIAARSTKYDFADRLIFITSSACTCAFDIRFPSVVLCTRRLWVGFVPLDLPKVSKVVNSDIKPVRSHRAWFTMIPPYRSLNCRRVASVCLSRRLCAWLEKPLGVNSWGDGLDRSEVEIV